ncbi:MAG: hypothetical protein BGP04_13140 [Rhizobiales bacterium 62-17]|nr:MAG: hypothetical protein BGP04_13140 [Rhizobiales bacterium 62-17]
MGRFQDTCRIVWSMGTKIIEKHDSLCLRIDITLRNTLARKKTDKSKCCIGGLVTSANFVQRRVRFRCCDIGHLNRISDTSS